MDDKIWPGIAECLACVLFAIEMTFLTAFVVVIVIMTARLLGVGI